MVSLLARIQVWIAGVGAIWVLALVALILLFEKGKDTSPKVLLIILGFALLTLLMAFSAVQHARHVGELRWLGIIWTLAPVLLIIPPYIQLWIYNVSAATTAYFYVGVVAVAAGAVGLLREILNRTIGLTA